MGVGHILCRMFLQQSWPWFHELNFVLFSNESDVAHYTMCFKPLQRDENISHHRHTATPPHWRASKNQLRVTALWTSARVSLSSHRCVAGYKVTNLMHAGDSVSHTVPTLRLLSLACSSADLIPAVSRVRSERFCL